MERHSKRFGFRQVLSISCVLLVAGMGTVALAQTPNTPPPARAQSQTLAPQQLDNLAAPIALYPDPLLGQVLAACTYPVELVEAQQWLQANGNLHGQQLTDAARQQNWDASIQALVAMPDVLAKLNQDIQWTTDLGNAFLAQPADVMAAVQRLRARAQSNGRLQSNQQETVTTETQNGQQAIEIQPADPQIMYVPTYDPSYVWGASEWGAYPPLYYPAYGFGWYPGFNIGLCFGGWGGGGGGGWGWGWGPNWFGGGLFINGGFFNRYGYGFGGGYGGRFGAGFRGTTAWAHDASHRMGVGYSTGALNSRYGAASQASRIASARSGNYHSFGAAGSSYRGAAGATGSSYRGAAGAAGSSYRGAAGTAGSSYRGAAGNAASSYRGGATAQSGARSYGTQGASGYQHFQSGRQAYQAPAQRSYGSAGGQRYGSTGGQRYSAPSTQRYSAPAQHYSAPSGGGHSSGGGSVSHSSGGGGHAGGGGGHGGGRR
jgi:hypothetical protein